MDFEGFVKWQQEMPTRRVVKIELDGRSSKPEVWVYDYVLQTGQHVRTPEEIDLGGEVERRERELYDRLRQRFETVT